MKSIYTLLVLICSLRVAGAQVNTSLVVHEWGTFTSLQDESGQAIGGLNTDDEPVPEFVHTTLNMLVSPTQLPPLFFGRLSGSIGFFGKGIPSLHPDVTMRLETPVMYSILPRALLSRWRWMYGPVSEGDG